MGKIVTTNQTGGQYLSRRPFRFISRRKRRCGPEPFAQCRLRYPVREMGSWGEGEGTTVAILLYSTLVKLRAQSRGQADRRTEVSALLLDNPIGPCSKPEQVARTAALRPIAFRRRAGFAVRVFSLATFVTVPYSIAVSKPRRPFLSDRYLFIAVRLLRRREQFTEPDFALLLFPYWRAGADLGV